MRLLESPDVLAIASRVLACHVETVVDEVDLERLHLSLDGSRAGDESGDLPWVAAVLLRGLVRGRPFPRANRRIAVAATLQLVALNERDLALETVDLNRLLDDVASGAVEAPALTRRLRDLLRPIGTTDPGRTPGRQGESELSARRTRPSDKEGTMFERFTDRARQVVVLAQEEARRLNHNFIGTEHVLLGLVHEGEGLAARTLRELDISLDEVRSRVEETIGLGSRRPSGHIPFTPRSKKALEFALREAMNLGHGSIGTEHLLLSLLREGEGVAAQVLNNLGADLDRVRGKIIEIAGSNPPEESVGRPPTGSGRRQFLLNELSALLEENDRLHGEVNRLRELLRSHCIDPDEEWPGGGAFGFAG